VRFDEIASIADAFVHNMGTFPRTVTRIFHRVSGSARSEISWSRAPDGTAREQSTARRIARSLNRQRRLT